MAFVSPILATARGDFCRRARSQLASMAPALAILFSVVVGGGIWESQEIN